MGWCEEGNDDGLVLVLVLQLALFPVRNHQPTVMVVTNALAAAVVVVVVAPQASKLLDSPRLPLAAVSGVGLGLVVSGVDGREKREKRRWRESPSHS